MTTTFQDIDLILDEIAALFVANGGWEKVYDYYPGVDAIKGKFPVMIIQDAGTNQQMAGQFTNPVSIRILLSTWVLAYSEPDNWTTQNAIDKRRELNKTLRQIIRDNVGSLTNANNVEFDGFSETESVIMEGIPYYVETFAIIAHVHSGAI